MLLRHTNTEAPKLKGNNFQFYIKKKTKQNKTTVPFLIRTSF